MQDEDLPPLIQTPPGLYRHYKGGMYAVLATTRHSESLEPMTLYRALYGAHGLWVRPAAMFDEMVTWEGVQQRRFSRIGDLPADAMNLASQVPPLAACARRAGR